MGKPASPNRMSGAQYRERQPNAEAAGCLSNKSPFDQWHSTMANAQLNLFGDICLTPEPDFRREPRKAQSNVLCWTRMQAESGQDLGSIVSRKEMERRAGGGIFYWGIGNALGQPEIHVQPGRSIPIIFSKMLSRPKTSDSSPDSVLVWRKFVGDGSAFVDLPPHVLVLSRATTPGGTKSRHYALVCRARTPLRLFRHRSFDPNAYRNAGPANGVVGHSQVTALLRKVAAEQEDGRYGVDMEAEMIAPYFVRLADPVAVPLELRNQIENYRYTGKLAWQKFVTEIRAARFQTLP